MVFNIKTSVKDPDQFYHGYTKNYVKIYVKSEKDLSGKLIDVKINGFEDGRLIGKLII